MAFDPGLTYRSTNQLEKSMEQFVKLQTVLRHQPEVLFQIANINEELGNDDQAVEWFELPFQLLTLKRK